MKQPLIIVCPMRSFSSVVCAMVGQHPQMYGLPEVNLFIADTVEEVLRLHEHRPHGMHGLLRALAQLEWAAQTEETIGYAKTWMENHRDWSTRQVFDLLLERVEPRTGVDKSPRTVLQKGYLERSRAMYPQASYLHLTRHPRSTSNSLLANQRRNVAWGGTFEAGWVDPEKIWLRGHKNIVDLTATLPLGQCMRIRGEDFLSEPEVYLPQIAEWLDIDTSPQAIEAMMHPERSPFSSYGPENAKYGNDVDFLENPGLRRRKIAEPSLRGELEWAADREFSKPVFKLAREFGYA